MAINVPIVSEFAPDGVKKAMQEFKRLETTSQKVGFAMKKAFVPATAAIAGLAAAATVATKAAIDDAKQQDELARQLEVTTGATAAQVAAVEEYIAKTEMAAAVSDTELRPAFANLVRATGSVTEAQELMTLALDVAAGTGRDLESVSEALQEAYQGEVGPLKELDRSLTDMIASGADADEVMGQLAETFGGAAARNTETVAGRFELMQIQIQNAQESIGLALLPILEKLLPILEDVATFVAENTELFIAAGVAIGALSTIVIAYNAALKVKAAATGIATAAQFLFNKTMEANPAVRIAMIILTLVGVLFALEKKFGVVTKVLEAGKIVMDALGDAARWLAGKFVDFINTLIDVANKIPFVSIDKLTNVFDEQAIIVEEKLTPAIEGYGEAELEVAEAIAEAAYQQQLANLDYSEAEKLMSELHPTQDEVRDAIERMNRQMDRHIDKQERINGLNTDLIDTFDKLFDRFDNRRAVQNFSDAIEEAEEAMREYGEGSREAIEASEELYIALGEVIKELDNIPETKQLQLLAELDAGMVREVEAQLIYLQRLADLDMTLMEATSPFLMDPTMFLPATSVPAPSGSVDINGGATKSAFGKGMNVVINMPAGSDGAEVVRAIEREGRKRGGLRVANNGSVRS